jgi:hypothetical protein
MLYLAVLLPYCWLLQDEMDCSLIEVDCQGSANNVAGVCLVWVSKELPLFGQLPLWIICAGVFIIVWSTSYSLGICILHTGFRLCS